MAIFVVQAITKPTKMTLAEAWQNGNFQQIYQFPEIRKLLDSFKKYIIIFLLNL